MKMLEEITRAEKVLILGFAREGQSTYKFLRKEFPDLKIGCADKITPKELPSDKNTIFHFGSDYLDSLKEYPLVIKSAGISPHTSEIESAQKLGVIFTSHTQLFFEKCKSKNIIGITGTKGKSTTTTLIHHILETAKKNPALVGNIGIPALDSLEDIEQETYVVFELSSYQLLDLKCSPHIAVLLPIFQDHLDYHSGMEEYRNAKLNITKYQSADDVFICHASHKNVQSNADTTIFTESELTPDIKSNLVGEHNKINVMAAVTVADALGIDKDVIRRAVASYKQLDLRLQKYGPFRHITFVADTLATIPEATIAAIDAIKPHTLIAGGHERDQNYSKLAKKIVESGVGVLILFPTTGSRIKSEVNSLLEQGGHEMTSVEVDSMEAAVAQAFKHTPANKTCLLSPAAPSFSIFKDYRDEAEQFHDCVKKFGQDT